MSVDIAVQEEEQNVQAAHDLFHLMQAHQMEFVIRDHEGEHYLDVHVRGCDKLLGGGRGGLGTAAAERIYNCRMEMLGEMLSK